MATVSGGNGNDVISGSGDADFLNGNGGNDVISAGGGNDTVFGGDGADVVNGGDGNDRLNGGIGNDNLTGGTGNDEMFGGDGVDMMSGDAGSDWMFGGLGNDQMFGGADTDTLSGGDGSDFVSGDDGNDSLLGDGGMDTLSGGLGNDTVIGGQGADNLSGGDGNDSLLGGDGNDTVNGGDGADMIRGDASPAATWNYRVYDRDFSSANDQAFQIEQGTLRGDGTTADFNITQMVQQARGNASADPEDFGIIITSTYTAGAGGTYRFTTTSDDGSTMRILDANGNPLNFANQTGGTRAYLNNDFHQSPTTRFGDVVLAPDTVYTIEIRMWENLGGQVLDATVRPPGETTFQPLVGNPAIGNAPGAGNDILTGGAGADTVYGEAGNDSIDGGTDADRLYGGAGNDRVDGGDGDDLAEGGTGDDTLLGGTGNDTLSGDAGDDYLSGDSGNDSLLGGAGNDTLIGGDGIDTLRGGEGADLLQGDGGRDIIFAGVGDTVMGGSTGDDYDILDLTEYGRRNTRTEYDLDDPKSGTVSFLDAQGNVTGQLRFENIEQVIPCFTPGTLILTPQGAVPVETLRAGDTVVTRDSGVRTLRWVGRRDLTAAEVRAQPSLIPVRIAAGALGSGPDRELLLSPQHRILVGDPRAALFFGEDQVLVAACHLIDGKGVTRADEGPVSYLHLLCDGHEILCSNGLWTESFQPAARVLAGMDEAQATELRVLFPGLSALPVWPSARRSLRAHEARLLFAA